MAKRLVECVYCKGKGKRSYLEKGMGGALQGEPTYEFTCPVCFGRRKVEVEEPARRCGFCGGTGQSKRGSLATCPVCKGRGMITVIEPASQCPACRGRGRKPGSALYCIRCKGTGFVATARV